MGLEGKFQGPNTGGVDVFTQSHLRQGVQGLLKGPKEFDSITRLKNVPELESEILLDVKLVMVAIKAKHSKKLFYRFWENLKCVTN